MAKSKIYIKPSKRGSLRKATGTKKGEKIPASKLKVKAGDSAAMKKKKIFAQNARKWKHADGGKVEDPIKLPGVTKKSPYLYVTDPNDPRLKAYQDSLNIYNKGLKDIRSGKGYPYEIDPEMLKYLGERDYNQLISGKAYKKAEGLMDTDVDGLHVFEARRPGVYDTFKSDKQLTTVNGISPTSMLFGPESLPMPVYKKPVQPVKYIPKPIKEIFDEEGQPVKDLQDNYTIQPNDLNPIDEYGLRLRMGPGYSFSKYNRRGHGYNNPRAGRNYDAFVINTPEGKEIDVPQEHWEYEKKTISRIRRIWLSGVLGKVASTIGGGLMATGIGAPFGLALMGSWYISFWYRQSS